ncbi:Metallo-dependent phosphatase [Aaosphaeria arxii CBS 175.79]|uniref:Metallo-dependent phosphatase n=1 Tax=Aaosphaeria arxii CBS 175.79 TaxID=1450172 RepID=A0A6A5Y2S9_9PLEO|nr:Metallo-dependent phosphatase [Aaosphaeria arxii CBS 175.79]KAF2019559.1 Metallo-dependent phosphatase [Aaosphaeria arxii CBS 175.79]
MACKTFDATHECTATHRIPSSPTFLKTAPSRRVTFHTCRIPGDGPPPDPFERTSFLKLLLHSPVKLLLYHLYRILSSLRSLPTPTEPKIRIVCISDTHTRIPEDVPAGDILIHAGDMTNAGSVAEIQRQVDWLAGLPHKEIVVISGNHDTYLDPRTRPSLSDAQQRGGVDWKRVHYLQHRKLTLTIEVEAEGGREEGEEGEGETTRLLGGDGGGQRHRRLVIYGAPQIPACGPMDVHAFQYPRGRDAWSETVPQDIDVLVTHTPPKYHRDMPLPTGMGCEHLMSEVRRVRPSLHVFGHVHFGAGQEVVWWDRCHEAYEKGMAIQSKWSRGLLNPWLWWNTFRVGYRGLRELIWDKVWGGQGPSTIMVNAAQMYGNTGKLGNPVQVVEI